jgi:hypothetical protein
MEEEIARGWSMTSVIYISDLKKPENSELSSLEIRCICIRGKHSFLALFELTKESEKIVFVFFFVERVCIEQVFSVISTTLDMTCVGVE